MATAIAVNDANTTSIFVPATPVGGGTNEGGALVTNSTTVQAPPLPQQQQQQQPAANDTDASNNPQQPLTTTTVTSYTVPAGPTTTGPSPSTYQGNAKIGLRGLTGKSTYITCPHCNHRNFTRTRNLIDCCTVVGVVVMLFVFWPLFWLPFVCPCCMSTEHYCSQCHRKVS